MAALLTMHTVSGAFTGLIFTIRFTGIAGIMIHIYTIHFITPRGIRLIIAGAGEAIGIHPITVGDGVIHPITAIGTGLIMPVSMEDITADTLILTGMDMEATGILIQKITVTGKDVQPDPVYFMVMMKEEEPLPLVYGHQPQPPKVRRKG